MNDSIHVAATATRIGLAWLHARFSCCPPIHEGRPANQTETQLLEQFFNQLNKEREVNRHYIPATMRMKENDPGVGLQANQGEEEIARLPLCMNTGRCRREQCKVEVFRST